MDTTDNNKNIKMLKNKLQTRIIHTETKVIIFRENQVVEETTLLNKIQRNSIREQEVQKELDEDEGQAYENDGIVYMEGRIYIPNNWKI